MGRAFNQVVAEYVGQALREFDMYEEERRVDEIRYRSREVNDLVVFVRKDFVNEISLVVWVPSQSRSYTAIEVAHWANVSLPDMVVHDSNDERIALRWMADFVRAHYGPILLGNQTTLLSLDKSTLELGKRLTHESNKRSAQSAARLAARLGDYKAVIRYLAPFSNELDPEYRALLVDANRHCSGQPPGAPNN